MTRSGLRQVQTNMNATRKFQRPYRLFSDLEIHKFTNVDLSSSTCTPYSTSSYMHTTINYNTNGNVFTIENTYSSNLLSTLRMQR